MAIKSGSFLEAFKDGDPAPTTTALAPATETAVAETWQDFTWESDGTEDIAPSFPIIKIVQPTSTMEGNADHMGYFWRSDTEGYYKDLEVVALFKKNTRAYFEQGKDQPSCASDDGVYPRPNQPVWSENGQAQPQFCDQCPLSVWKGDEPPQCRASMVVLVEHEGELAQLRIGGASIKPFKQFVAKKLVPKKLPLFSQRLTLETEAKTKPGKKWFQLVVKADPLSMEEAKRFNGVLQYERGRFEEAVRETHDVEPQAEGVEWGDGEEPFK